MKKFVFPEINCVELSKTEAIMTSTDVGESTKGYQLSESQLTNDYKIWKGFSN